MEVEARFFRKEGEALRCLLCPRHCLLKEGQWGVCGTRRVIEGSLKVLTYGSISALEMRPMEAKPFYHFLPGGWALTFSSWGCNLLCPWCQNYHLSFARQYSPWMRGYEVPYISPEEVVEMATGRGADAICGSFMEPLMMTEYLLDLFPLSRKRGVKNTLVTNGYVEEGAMMDLMRAGLDAISLDIKGDEGVYRRYFGAHLDPVLNTLTVAVKRGVHVELVYLAVSGISDSEEVFKGAFDGIMDVVDGESLPLHINRYHPTPLFTAPPTQMDALLRLREVALEMGFRFVYVGNTGDDRLQWTTCPSCGEVLIKRRGLYLTEMRAVDGRCPNCGYQLPGLFTPHRPLNPSPQPP